MFADQAFDAITDNWSFEKDMTRIMQSTKDYLIYYGPPQFPPIGIIILDTGINQFHRCFEGFQLMYMDFVGEENITPSQDPYGHGTFVTGIICQILQDVKHLVKICVMKVADKEGKVAVHNLEHAYEYIKNDPEMRDFYLICQPNGFEYTPGSNFDISDIAKKKTLICAASNNGRCSLDTVAWPAKKAVAIGSHDENFERVGSSPIGPDLWVLAPGKNIVSASNKDVNGDYSNVPYDALITDSGTSYAAPWVTALLVYFHLQLEFRCALAGNFIKNYKNTRFTQITWYFL